MPAAAVEATPPDGWATLFRSAFVDSRAAMLLLDDRRRELDLVAPNPPLIHAGT
jgi:hypothetical protein